MNFLGDYHTHTIYSRKFFMPYHHAKGTIEDNIASAKQMGLKEIAITDHGFNHKFFGCSRRKLKTTKDEILRLSQKYGVKVYFGVEANFIGVDGTIDVKEEDKKYLDIILCGFHKSAKAKNIKEKFSIFWKNFFANFFGTSHKLIEQNTLMICNALEKNKIDILTHLNSKLKCDVEKIAILAKRKGTLIELNEKHCDFSKEEINKMVLVGVNFVVDSDAHKPENIGKFKKVEEIIKKYDIPENLIINLNKVPEFLNKKNI